jgi:hypothetical protein
VAKQQFLSNESSFDRLAEAHVICDQQVDAWHLQATHEWIELVVLDRDPAPEWGLEGLHVCVGGSAPSDGVQEGIDSSRFIELTNLRQSGLLKDAGARFQLPNHLELFAQRILVDRRKRQQVFHMRPTRDLSHDVLALLVANAVPLTGRWQTGTEDVSYDPLTATDLDELALLRRKTR